MEAREIRKSKQLYNSRETKEIRKTRQLKKSHTFSIINVLQSQGKYVHYQVGNIIEMTYYGQRSLFSGLCKKSGTPRIVVIDGDPSVWHFPALYTNASLTMCVNCCCS